MAPLFCTIFDRPRRGALRGLVDALHAQDPDARVLALYLGEEEPLPVEGAEVIELDALGDDGWLRIAATAPQHRDAVLTGPLLRAALERAEQAVFLGTWLRAVGPLDAIEQALEGHDLVLVPVAEAPLPDDDHEPSADVVAAAGPVNPRVIGLRRSPLADELLAGWPQTSEPDSTDGPAELTPGAVEAHLGAAAQDPRATILADRGIALGYWNLPLRPIAEGPDGLTAAGDRLALLDLTGMAPDHPDAPWPGQDRVDVDALPGLPKLLDELAGGVRLEDPGAFSSYHGDLRGRPLDAFHRRLLREAYADGAVKSAPWTHTGTAELDAWFDVPSPRGAKWRLTRYHHEVWLDNDELQRVYPDLDGEDGERFTHFLIQHHINDGKLSKRNLPPGVLSPAREELLVPWGVNVAGFFRSELGLGEAARLLITALDAANVPALPVQGSFVPPTRQDAEFTFTTPDEAPYPINIICINGDVFQRFAREAADSFFDDRHTIALWWWEVVGSFPPDWKDSFEYLDEIWVATDTIYDAVAPHSPVPVHKVRMPVTMPRIAPIGRETLGFPDGFTFLYVYDYHSTAARKNPVGHVEAFKKAFGEGSGAKLVLKCINADRMPEHHERTMLAIDGHPDITVIDRFVSADEKNAMIAACDCYVSLHRSEGFGLTPAEAMALGKPVIATRYGGVLDFMTDENSYLVDHGWTKVGRAAHPYPPDGTWAEPDTDHAAKLMREVFDDPAEARRRGRRGAQDILERHAPHATGHMMRGRLQEIHDEIVARGGVDKRAGHRDLTHAAAALHSPVPAPAGRALAVKRPARKVMDKALAPYVSRQRTNDHELLKLIEELYEQVAEARDVPAIVDRHIREERTQTLAALRRIRSQLGDHERWLATVDIKLNEVRDALEPVLHHVGEQRSLPYMSEPWEQWEDPQAGRVEGFRTPAPSQGAAAYQAFEHRFRGTRERIMELQRPYVELLAGREPVLDCGCGRGELVELLNREGIKTSGVDLDEGMLAEARELGLDVVTGDAVQFLREAKSGAYGAVTAMQVIEHLPYAELQAFLRAARGALRAGGRLVVETVNPHAVSALKGFWLDPTHEHPLFPDVVLELCREAGFSSGFVFHPNGEGDVQRDRYADPAYAIVADVA